MIIRSVELPFVCGVKSTLPKTGKPEFVLAGRSIHSGKDQDH